MDEIICGDAAEVIEGLDDKSIDIVVTSPPYFNARPEYAEYATLGDFMSEMTIVFGVLRRKLKYGARVCINTASGYGRSPYIHLGAEWLDVMSSLGYDMRGEIVWDKGASVGSSTAWGSWMSPSNPHLRDQHEMVYVYDYRGHKIEGGQGRSTLLRDEFLTLTKSVWEIPTRRSKVHPAVMPEELARRLINLYSYEDAVVLDPFCGIGTTCIAAQIMRRKYIGIDRKETYVDHAREVLAQGQLW